MASGQTGLDSFPIWLQGFILWASSGRKGLAAEDQVQISRHHVKPDSIVDIRNPSALAQMGGRDETTREAHKPASLAQAMVRDPFSKEVEDMD